MFILFRQFQFGVSMMLPRSTVLCGLFLCLCAMCFQQCHMNIKLSVWLDLAKVFEPFELWPSLGEELSLHRDVLLAQTLVHDRSAQLGLFPVQRSVKPPCLHRRGLLSSHGSEPITFSLLSLGLNPFIVRGVVAVDSPQRRVTQDLNAVSEAKLLQNLLFG